MESRRRIGVADWAMAATTPVVFVAALALVAWALVGSLYAWTGPQESWILTFTAVMVGAITIPVVFMARYERFQVRHGRGGRAGRFARIEEAACGLFAMLLGLLAVPALLFAAYLAVASGVDGDVAASAYFALACLAVLAVPTTFLHYFVRWRARACLA
ncbi:MAG: hypothetical protein WCA30_06085 [Dermatophilaceae bacterium]